MTLILETREPLFFGRDNCGCHRGLPSSHPQLVSYRQGNARGETWRIEPEGTDAKSRSRVYRHDHQYVSVFRDNLALCAVNPPLRSADRPGIVQ